MHCFINGFERRETLSNVLFLEMVLEEGKVVVYDIVNIIGKSLAI